MNKLAFISTVGLSVTFLASCTNPRAASPSSLGGQSSWPKEEIISPATSAFSNVVAKADQFVSQAKLSWGEPTEVRWQPTPLNRYVVIYATPTSELGWAGYRAVHVSTNGHVWFVPRG